MMRLIDADALINRMYHDAFETDTDMQKWDSGCWIRYKMFENAIDEQSTIEPKHGYWITRYVKSVEHKVCSECGAEIENVFFGFKYDVNFCPNCGARMKEGKL